MKVYVATKNAGKLREMAALFEGTPFALETYERYEAPAEGDASYTANAALKARALWEQLRAAGRPGAVVADDSGLEVFALGGRPGVLTAEYGGQGLPWTERRRLLRAELRACGAADRRARFVCVLHFIGRDGREFATMATVDGEIAPRDRGAAGFSFDPLFLYPPAGRTFAELPETEKNRVSHRAIAAAGLVAALARAGVAPDKSETAR
ncbi:MAG TPA: non-canonical purine NTP pyrophosphatase [Candidatus Elarobacter sp.]|jgi:XTP/dITP diphosphohydrolase